MKAFLTTGFICLLCAIAGATGAFPKTYYNYVEVDKTAGANMFYGIRGDKNESFRAASTTPLVMWLQGGPGATSQFGNFLENGPEKLELDSAAPGGFRLVEREHTWTKHANMLYVDNPVGTGFSYVEKPAGYTTTDVEIGDELVVFLRGFLTKHPEYQGRDFWIFCESYGGKMTAYFGAALAAAQNSTNPVPINFKGVSIGDGWVDPIACMKSYGPYLQGLSQLTGHQVAKANHYADLAADALQEGHGVDATNYWGIQQEYIEIEDQGTNWYNVLYYYDYTADTVLNEFLRTNFTKWYKDYLNPKYPYNNQSNTVFNQLQNTFMRDGVSQMNYLIESGYSVNVESGQVDLIVDTLCIQKWMSKLAWSGLDKFNKAPREAIYPGNTTYKTSLNAGGFVQQYKNVALWQIMKAGHMIPLDNPAMAESMFVRIIGGDLNKVNPVNPRNPNPYDTMDGYGSSQSKKGGTKKEGVIHTRKHTLPK